MKRGFTLLEMIIVVSVLAILFCCLFRIFSGL